MKVIFLLALTFLVNIAKIQSKYFNNPCLTIKNNKTKEKAVIEYDPNWDDQVLYLNGKTFTESLFERLAPGESIEICSIYEQGSPGGSFGIIVDKKYPITIRNIDLMTNKPLNKIIMDDDSHTLALSNITFLVANLFIKDADKGVPERRNLKFLK